ncbi:translation initiation factor IF-2-like [Lolium rigidum]|uniref:translation initiation factor IF-2-like n=1 Tax=Lolium rigidum TaxID=89674 RepID=UPI001F5D7578|nr:translation initiation factor IF-2-like [Lolium rigidum]
MPEKPPPPRRRPMAAGSWVRSLQCRSTAVEDVATLPKKPHLLLRSSCAGSGDIHGNKAVSSCKPKLRSGSKAGVETKKPKEGNRPATTVPRPPSPPPGPLGPLPALTELPAGHSSRQVVEIIFLSSWTPLPSVASTVASGGASFAGEVEMLFRVHNQARAVARFEDYRAAVRARAGGAARSAADGNEMMRFSPAPPHGGGGGGGASLRVVRTFDGSGGAHASGSGRGPGSGRRAMFLCRVIAGRVAEGEEACSEAEAGREEYDSARGGKGELVVFDRRAVLPCFLIIYKL